MFDNLKQDFATYVAAQGASGQLRAKVQALFAYGFIATVIYRYVRWVRTLQPRVLRLPFLVAYLPLKVFSDLVLGIQISANADIGPGLNIGHHGCIFIHCDAGSGLSVGQGVTIGYKGAGKSTRWPRLGNDIYIGTGARVIGDVEVGDGAVIGANTVVTKNVPPRTRVVGAAVRMTSLDTAS